MFYSIRGYIGLNKLVLYMCATEISAYDCLICEQFTNINININIIPMPKEATVQTLQGRT